MTYTCPACHKRSGISDDERFGYCSKCGTWTGPCQVGRAIVVKPIETETALPGTWDDACPVPAVKAWVFINDAGQLRRAGLCRQHHLTAEAVTGGQIMELPWWLTEAVA